MKPTITFAQQQFLELLRAGLWGTPADPALFTEEATDWKEILRIAKEQTVQVIVADGIETLPKEKWPPKQAMIRLMMTRVKTSQMHTLLNTTLCQVVNALNAEDIPSVLLKGQGVARNYRIPESRMCGDIDLYVGYNHFDRASEAIRKLNPTIIKEDIEHDHLHRSYEINGVTLELHQKASTSANKRQDRFLDRWTFENLDKHFQNGTLPTVMIGQGPVQVAPADYDCVFILHHAIRHMITEGIGFRQICDWVMYLHKNRCKIDENAVSMSLKQFHMTKIWSEFAILAHKVLGLPAEQIPLYPANDTSSKTENLLRNIFLSGNFGRYDIDQRNATENNYLKRKIRSLRFQTLRFFKIYQLFPRFTLSYICGWYPSAIIRLLRRR